MPETPAQKRRTADNDPEPTDTDTPAGPYRLVLATGEVVTADNVTATQHHSTKAGGLVPVVSSYRVED